MNAIVLRGDARRLPLPDASVDLIVTSPPYYALRDYRDGDASMAGQIGSEPTPQEWVAALVECTAEWARVLKPAGSMFVNLGDKYVADNRGSGADVKRGAAKHAPRGPAGYVGRDMARHKSLLGLPWRYALACTDQLGLILRRDIIWAKPNGLPESVTDRCRSSHEYLFHLVRQPRYYAAVDEIREPQVQARGFKGDRTNGANPGAGPKDDAGLVRKWNPAVMNWNPLGKLPGSVWEIASQPLTVPAHLGVDHFAAFPMELPRRCVLGWSPPGICTSCGEGRRPVGDRDRQPTQRIHNGRSTMQPGRGPGANWEGYTVPHRTTVTITGYACACTPYTDHPGTGGHRPTEHPRSTALGNGVRDNPGGGYGNAERTGPWREYHFDGWAPPPTRPAVILDPFGGTGTTSLVASMLGRIGVSIDRSADYTRLARWRCTDPGERAKAMQVPKPPPVPDGMEALF